MARFCRRIIPLALFALLSALSGAELGLETVPWTEAGYFGSHEGNKLPQINRNLQGNPLSIGGVRFKRGLAGHTPFTVFYSLGGMARSVSGFVGLDDEDHPRDRKGEELDTTVRFVILVDRKEVFRHTAKLGDKPFPFRVDLRGKQQLELRGGIWKTFPQTAGCVCPSGDRSGRCRAFSCLCRRGARTNRTIRSDGTEVSGGPVLEEKQHSENSI